MTQEKKQNHNIGLRSPMKQEQENKDLIFCHRCGYVLVKSDLKQQAQQEVYDELLRRNLLNPDCIYTPKEYRKQLSEVFKKFNLK